MDYEKVPGNRYVARARYTGYWGFREVSWQVWDLERRNWIPEPLPGGSFETAKRDAEELSRRDEHCEPGPPESLIRVVKLFNSLQRLVFVGASVICGFAMLTTVLGFGIMVTGGNGGVTTWGDVISSTFIAVVAGILAHAAHRTKVTWSIDRSDNN